MKVPRVANSLNYLDDDLISEAMEYKPKPHRFSRWMKWKTIAACLALIAVVIGILSVFNQPTISPLVLTAYALEGDDSISASVMTEGEYIPVSLFETETGLRGFVFSYDASDPTQPASVLIRDMHSPITSGERINEIVGFEAEQGKIYIYYILAEGAAAPYNLPTFITDMENDVVYQFNIVIEESGNAYTAELLEVAQYERRETS